MESTTDIRDSILAGDDPEQGVRSIEVKMEMDQHYKNCFGGESGKHVLADLYNRTMLNTSVQLGDPQGTAYNEGRRSVVLSIMSRIGALYAKPSFTENFTNGG